MSGASSYKVYGGTATISGITGTTYTSTGLTNNTLYNFTVTAVNSVGEGPASNTVSGYPNPTPAALTSLTATPITSFIHLAWTTLINGCTYNVFRGTTPGGEGGTAILTTSGSAINDTTAVAGTTYFYKVSATNGAGTSGLSNEASAATLIPPTLTLVSSGYVSGHYSMTVDWTHVSPANTYNVYLGINSGMESIYVSNYTFGTPVAFSSGLYANTTEYMYVTSLDSSGHESGRSNEVSALMPLDNPSGLTAAWSGTSVLLNWTAVSGATTYTIKRQIGSGTITTIGSTSSPTYTDSTLGTLPAGTSINYIVDASSSLNTDHGGSQVFITTPTVAPSGLTATGGIQSANLIWSGSTGTNYYNIKRSTTSGGPYTGVGAEGAIPTTYTDTGLSDNTTYYYVVSSVYTGGESANSNQAVVTTAPTSPASLSATAGARSVGLSWTASTGASSYNIYKSITTGGAYTKVGSSSSASYTATGLADTTAYFFVVTAVNSGGAESGYSNEATATTWLAPPVISALGCNSTVTVSWASVSGAAGYSIYRSVGNTYSFSKISGTSLLTGLSYVDSTVSNGTVYYYAATDTGTGGIGESAYSNPVQAIPQSGGYGTAVYQINTGGPAVGSWVADEFGLGSSATSTTDLIDTSSVVSPAPQAVYQSCDIGGLVYIVPGLSSGGAYTVRLHFADIMGIAPGYQLFNITINGVQVATNFDIAAATGAYDKAIVEQFNTTADSSGHVTIGLTNAQPSPNADPTMNGLEIIGGSSVPAAPFCLRAIAGHASVNLGWSGYAGLTGYKVYRATTSGGSYTLLTGTAITTSTYVDSTASNGTTYFYVVTALNTVGESLRSNEASATPLALNAAVYKIDCGGPAVSGWSADQYFSGGNSIGYGSPQILTGLINPAPVTVYVWGHFGTTTYTLPYLIPGNNYVVRLHYCDPYNLAGADLQNVSINGSQVLTNYDVNAGGVTPGQANIQEFNTTANGSGNIAIVFTDVKGTSEVCGIEVLTDTLAPSPPQALVAWRGTTQARLSWLPVSGATGYNLKRSTVSGGPYTTIAPNTSSTVYSDPTTANDYYVVTALNATGESANSNEAYPVLPFVLSANPSTVSEAHPGSTFSEVTASSNLGFAGTINFTGVGLGTGMTGVIYPTTSIMYAPYLPYQTVKVDTMIQLCATSLATVGTYPITITGTSGDYSASTVVTLTVH